MTRDWVMRGAGYILTAVGVLAGVVILAIAVVGFVPMLAVAFFWDARPMTWESEFNDEFNGATLTSWVLQGYGEKFDTGGGYYLGSWPNGQPLHLTGGLLDYAVQRHAVRLVDTITDPDDNDD